MSRTTLCLALALVVVASPFTARAGIRGGIGVLGDSYSDEYRFYPPNRSAARNWVEILAEARGLDFGGFSAESRGEPRNQGYAYNWARSDATTDSLIDSGQHTGLAEQVRRGEVGLVVVFVGGNDFINAMHAPDPGAALRAMLPRAMDNYRVAVRTVLDASPEVKLILATLPDIRDLPEFAGPIREGRIPVALADTFSAAMRTYNAQVRAIATSESRMGLLDLDRTSRCANLLGRDTITVAGRKLDRRGAADDLDHFFLGDVRHPGTLGQALLARLFIGLVNTKFAAGIPDLDDAEVLAIADSALAGRGASEIRLTGLVPRRGRGE